MKLISIAVMLDGVGVLMYFCIGVFFSDGL